MPKKKTHDEFIAQLKAKQPKIHTSDIYKNGKTKIEFECIEEGCNHKWRARPDNILSGYGCPECAKRKRSKALLKTHEEFVTEVAKINPNIIVIGKYVRDDVKIELKCKMCGYTWFATPDKILHKKTGCPECAKIKRAKLRTKKQEEFENEVYKKNKNIKVLSEYKGAKVKVKFQCLVCGCVWWAYPYSVTSLSTGCPRCVQSHGEREITNWLLGHNVNFIPQHKFADCKDKIQLPFDFYLPDYNLCIEYDGIQHFEPVNFGGISNEEALIKFMTTKLHDDIKNKYCSQYKINLLRISYLDNGSIDKILNNIINN